MRKVCNIRIANLACDVCNGVVQILQQRFGGFDPKLLNISCQRNVHAFTKEVAQIDWRYMHMLGDVTECQLVRISVSQIIDNFSYNLAGALVEWIIESAEKDTSCSALRMDESALRNSSLPNREEA